MDALGASIQARQHAQGGGPLAPGVPFHEHPPAISDPPTLAPILREIAPADLALLAQALGGIARWVTMPMTTGPTLGYATVGVNQGGIVGAEVDLTGLSVTATLAATRRLRVTASYDILTDTAGDIARGWIKTGVTYLQSCDSDMRLANQRYRAQFQVVTVQTAGVWTFKLAAIRNSGAGTLTVIGNGILSGSDPPFILVEDIGT